MSSTRTRNKYCLSLDNTSSYASSNTIHLNRWSEVVPPKTALTFAALWDPEEGMVTFSGAALLESESLSGMPSHPDALDDDDRSQYSCIDQDSDRCSTTSANTTTLTTFQDAFKAFLHRTPLHSREHLHIKEGQGTPGNALQARASSTFDGLDVYSHDIQAKPKRSLQLSCIDLLDIESSFRTPSAYGRLRLRSDLMLDSYAEESGSKPLQLKSRFSTTTTSTSNYVDVTAGSLQLTHTSETTYVPGPESERVSPVNSWPSLPQRRRLRKRRPRDSDCITTVTTIPSTPRRITRKSSMSPASPPPTATTSRTSATLVSQRGRLSRQIRVPVVSTPPAIPQISAPPPATPSPPPKSPRLKLRFTLLPKRKSRQTSPDSDGWVFIEVTPIIQQRYMADLG